MYKEKLIKLNKENIEDIIALTPMQEGMLFYYLKDPASDLYFEQLCLEISGEIDVKYFEQAWNSVVENNEMLRTVFRWEKMEKPTQVILKEHYIKVRYYDLSNRDDEEKHKPVEEIKTKDKEEKFDLHCVAFRVTLITLKKDRHVIIISNHHILYDGWSNGIILEEFFNAYHDSGRKKTARKPGKSKFKDYIRWRQNQDEKSQEKFWKSYLKGFDTSLELSVKRSRGKEMFSADNFTMLLGKETREILEQFLHLHHITLTALLYSAWGLLLQRYNNTDDVIFGTTVSGRTPKIEGIENIVGLFINTPPLRVQTFPGEKVIHWLKRMNQALQIREPHGHTSLAKIKEYSELNPDERIFDTIVVIENYPLPTGSGINHPDRRLSIVSYRISEMTEYDLTVIITITEEVKINFIYNAELLTRDTIERLGIHFSHLLEKIVKNSHSEINEIDVLPNEETARVLFEFNRTEADYPGDKTIQRLFEEQVGRTPDNIAAAGPLEIKYRTYMTYMAYISYRELNEKSNRLAHLLQQKGVGPDTIVGIMAERSIEMMIGIFGILKAGGAYLPIEPEYPEERIKYMLKDSSARILLKKSEIRNPKSETNPNDPNLNDQNKRAGVSVLDFEHLKFEFVSSFEFRASNLNPSNLAYIIYTSGSTGRPKGVLVQHQNVVPLVKNSNFIDFTPDDRLLLTGALGFDITTFEIWWPLLNGLTLFLADQRFILDPGRLGNFMIKNKISILHLIPGLFNQLALQRLEIFAGLTYFLVGGDLVQPRYINLLRNTCKDIKILHMYGPTENTTFSTFHPVNQDYDTLIPIGKPIGNSRVYIADKFDKLVPVGVPGELLVGGEGVARGYLNNPELTAEKFDHDLWDYRDDQDKRKKVPGKGVPGRGIHRSYRSHMSYIYQTGDLARWRPDGDIEFLGRIDSQVKIRGFRIEPGEIENQLLNHRKIKETLVTLGGANQGEAGEQYLCAYIVPTENQTLESAELRNHLAEKIPGYMIPSYFILLDNIPLTANGKVDLRALPAPAAGEPGKIETAPRGPIEKRLVNIWAEVLKVPPVKINIDSNFFELGGHSLKAAQLMAKIQSQFNTHLSLKEIFKFPTIRQLATIVSMGESTTATMPNVEEQEYYKVSYNQERLWNFQRLNPGSGAYNIFGKISFNRDIHVNGVRETLFKLIRRHESFRTRFKEINGQPIQFIETNAAIPLEIIDLSFLKEEKKELEAEKIYRENCRKPFNLTCAPLFRAVLLKLGTGCWDFIFVIHHIISDGWSHQLLKKEFLAFYNGFPAGKDITLPPMQFRYRDFALWQRHRSSDLAAGEEVLNYWRSKFEKGFPELQLPLDRNGDPDDRSGITFRSVVPPDIKKSLQLLGETHHTSLFMILFSAFNRCLSTFSGQGDIVCRVPAAGRDQPAVQAIMGYLVNPIFLKNRVKHNERFVDLLHRVTENTLEAFRYQWYPFEQVLENLGREYPAITVSFNMLTMQEREAETDLEQWDSFFTGDTGDAKFPLNVRITVYRNGIEIFWNAQKSLFNPAALEKLARQYVRVLKMISNENQDF